MLEYVFIEVLLVGQSLVAYMTLVFASIMFVLLMRGQSLTIRANRVANIATHRLLFLLETYVSCKIKFCSEKFAAIIAHIRLVTGMKHLMLREIRFVSEGYETDGTTKWFLSCVPNNMLLQMITRRKCLSALLTYVLFVQK